MSEIRPITIVVPTRNRPKMLAGCLDSIRGSMRQGDELIVVDSASTTNQVREVAEHYGARYIRCNVAGASRARNQGWRASRYDVVAYVDDDVRVDAGWVSAVAKVFEDPGTTFMTGRIVEPPSSNAPEVASKTETKPARLDALTSGVIGHSANLAVRRRALEYIGGFDERLGAGGRFRAAEDLDLFDRLFHAGYVGRYEPEASAVHEAWRRGREYIRLQGAYGIGVGARIAKLAKTDGGRARHAARSAFVESGLSPLAKSVRERSVIGFAARSLRILGTVGGIALGIAQPVRDGHFGGRPNAV